jgi:lyso-ornithine lipid O-acyltransferase
MILRRIRRMVALALALLWCAVRFNLARWRGPLGLEARAEWLQDCARRVLGCLGIRLVIEGQPPARGLVVSNHLSYLDIVLYAAAAPCCFVSKSEVRRWPVFGGLARAGATIFLDRASQKSASAAVSEMARRLEIPVPILLFPEGTSSDGAQVLRFHARLFQPAVEAQAPVTEAAIGYRHTDGAGEEEICWHGNADFVPHLWKVLGIRGICARIRFGQPKMYSDARMAARRTQAEVTRMRVQMCAPGSRPFLSASAERAAASF